MLVCRNAAANECMGAAGAFLLVYIQLLSGFLLCFQRTHGI